MKYYLIIGYYLKEKNENFPRIRVSIGNKFVDEFTCDNETLVDINLTEKIVLSTTWDDSPYKSGTERTTRKNFNTPKNNKIFELDSSDWVDGDQLRIEILGNNSNYNNGFMTKRSLVSLRPIFLLPETLMNNEGLLKRIAKKNNLITFKLEQTYEETGVNFEDKWQWPCVANYKGALGPDDLRGGQSSIVFQLAKKFNTFMLVDPKCETKLIGFPIIPEFFFAWIQNFKKVKYVVTRKLEKINHTDMTQSLKKSTYIDE
jgi:hypothetical protein